MQNDTPATDCSALALTEIATKHLNITTLVEQKADGLDLHDVVVWNIRAALEAAIAAGNATADLARIS